MDTFLDEYGYIVGGLLFFAVIILIRQLVNFTKKFKKNTDNPNAIEKRVLLQELFESTCIGLLLVFLVVAAGTSASATTSSSASSSTLYNIIAILCFFFIGAGFKSGWKFLSEQTSDLIITAPIISWLYLYVFKFAIAVVIGLFLAPSYLFQRLQRLYELSKKERQ